MTDLHPFFQAIRSTLKDLTEQVNYQWEVRTPSTPRPQRIKGLNETTSSNGQRSTQAGKA